MKRFLLITTVVIGIALIAMFLSTCSAMGTLPTDEERKAFERSPQYIVEKKAFDNRRPNLYDKMYARISYSMPSTRCSRPRRPLRQAPYQK